MYKQEMLTLRTSGQFHKHFTSVTYSSSQISCTIIDYAMAVGYTHKNVYEINTLFSAQVGFMASTPMACTIKLLGLQYRLCVVS
jgi:hypothetical protein